MSNVGAMPSTRRVRGFFRSDTLSTQREQDVSQTKHTPGPWTFDRDWRRIPMIFGADGMPVASIEKGITLKGIPVEPHCEANARLIAYWINRPAPEGQDEFSTSAASMFTPPDPATGTCNTE